MTWTDVGLLVVAVLFMLGTASVTYWRLAVYADSASEDWLKRVRQLAVREDGHGHQ